MTTCLCTLSGVGYSYGGSPALESVSWSLYRGTLTAVLGPNGGGKSTFLKLLTGLILPSTGHLQWHEAPLFSYLPQRQDFDRSFPFLVEDVVAMGFWPKISPRFWGHSRKTRNAVSYILSQVGLTGVEKRSLQELSGGQFQRVLFARLMARQSEIIFLDEPFAGIDSHTIQDLLRLIQTWHQQGKTIVTVLHDIELIRQFFPQTLLISGRLIEKGRTEKVLLPSSLAQALSSGSSIDV